MRPVYRALGALTTVGLLASTLTACSARSPDPQPAAEALAVALGSADFSGVPLADAQSPEVAEVVQEAFRRMGQIPRTHTLASIAADETDQDVPTATAVIHTVWDIDDTDEDLAYETSAVFEFDGETEQWQLRFDPQLLAPQLSEGGYLAARHTTAERGEIHGADGQVLVTNRPVVRVGLDKSHLEPDLWEGSARALAELVGIDADAYAERVAAAGQKAWVEAIVLRDDADREIGNDRIATIAGATVQQDELPLAPTRGFARPLLGTVGQATAEIIEKSEGSIQAGEQVGLSGLQATYNSTLAGTPGTTITRNSATHEVQDELFSSSPVPGTDLELTLDRELQELADTLVADAQAPAALVAIRPSDGSVLAVASGPESSGYNTALLGQYAPGSTFKVVSALAMLRAGATAETAVDCPATTTVDGKSFKNYDGYPAGSLGRIELREAVAQSCNTVFVNAGAELGAPALAEAAAALGLTAADSSGAGAFTGSVPSDSSGTELAANMIGQGVVQSSTLGMATVAASVAAGHTVNPQLVLETNDEPEPADTAPADSAAAPKGNSLAADEAEALALMMREVVRSGTLTLLDDLPGDEVIGKSGTAEYDADRNAHAWTIAAQGDLAIAAFVEDGSGGAQTAGPLVRDFLSGLPR
ncbi:penicillin-binding transpeptidase domain-containing protein [Glutamicibacter sp. MNS18]|uniref:penicillin-binding transpeptidase domain-containing protein n=1 Tax=Glutamicibacter sp. MNS18 TaxID=2989817 RepID=UPI002235C3A1|nr:penicillin-binding transpeptidase domain-containing protein [Glutamicibacter sp. MNS18]MCW4465050.1 penicillin-binding transpeptidase domain-containing protein [Glutamicibacter sp. MNS18]